MDEPDWTTKTPPATPPNAARSSGAGSQPDTRDGLRMTREEMTELARRTVEHLVERVDGLGDDQAWDGDFQWALEAKLLEAPPEDGHPAAEVIDRAVRDILPFSMRLDHPRFFGLIPSSPTWPGVLADFMAAAYNVNVATWLTASGPSAVELVVIDWIRGWLGYPEGAGGLFTSGGSAASLEGLVAAREAAGHPERGTVYLSEQGHSAPRRAAMIAGIRAERIRSIPCDERFRLDMDALREIVAADRAAGFNPIAVCANAGAASTGAIDPLEAMADYCEAEGIWLHVDGAYGGFAVICDEGKQALRGIERADSIGVDAHKWLFQPYQAGCLLVKDTSTLETAFAFRHDVLQDTIWGANHPNLSDRGLQLSRSFGALKVWMSVQTFGMAAFRQAVAGGMQLAVRAEEFVRKSSLLEVLTPSSLGVVCFRVNPVERGLDDKELYEVNKTVLARVFWDDPAFITSTTLNGKLSLRLCIMNHSTTWNDVWETLESIEKFGVDALAVHDKQADTAWATKPPCSCVGCESRDVRGVNAGSVLRDGQTNRMEKSAARTCLVRAPTEMKSTPVRAVSRTLSRSTPPEASSATLGPSCVLRSSTARRISSKLKLSNRTRSTSHASASRNSPRFSTSTSSITDGALCREAPTARRSPPAAAMWFSLMRMAS